ncbi:MAG: GDSL-type esterase/lipase family protein [Paludisphaera borealis]|nr:GDSL-type esterase/lipase family protein [Paludisphaera borealis]
MKSRSPPGASQHDRKGCIMARLSERHAWTAAILAATSALGLAGPSPATAGDYGLGDGDTVVFLGDSITAARVYGRIVENYTLLRYPTRKVHFHNAGWGGDTASGGLKRLDRDVFPLKPTVVIVAYGVNDIGWGMKADDEHKKAYLDGIRGIVEACKAHGARAYVCSAAATAEAPETAEHGYLQTMCDEGMALARSLGGRSIDVQRSMRAVQRRMAEGKAKADPKDKDGHTLHVADGVHLNDLGQLAMALAIIKGLGAPAEVSSVSLAVDPAGPRVVAAEGCRATNLTGDANRLEFDRLDDGLPLNLGLFGALQYRYIPIPDEINRYMLTIQNLPPGDYTIQADGRPLGKFAADRLARGVNLASATADGWQPGGPWEAQAWSLSDLTEARSRLAMSRIALAHHLPNNPRLAAIEAQTRAVDERIETLQREILAPRPFHFVVEKAAENP